MSYALGQAATRMEVGRRAAQDPILARASLESAKLLTKAARRPRSMRLSYLRARVASDYDRPTADAFFSRAAGARTDQAVYDALRLAVANHYTRIGLRYLQRKLKSRFGDDFRPTALSGEEEEAIGCAIGGGASAILATVVGAYTGGTGAAPIGAAGLTAMQAAGCGADQQAAQQALAEAQAAAAAAELERARLAAEAEAARSAAQQKTMITVAAIGGGALLLLGIGYAIIK